MIISYYRITIAMSFTTTLPDARQKGYTMIKQENLKVGQVYQTERGTQFKVDSLKSTCVVNSEVINGESKYPLLETYDSFLRRLNNGKAFLVK